MAPLALNRVEPGTIAYAVLLAGPGVPGGDLLRQQLRRIAAANGAPAEMIEELAALQDRGLEIIASDMPPAEAEAALREVAKEQMAASPETAQLSGEDLETALSAAVETNLSPWFRFFIRYDPRPALGGLAVPTLALFGGKDTQVDADQNQSAMEAAFAGSGNRDITVRRFPRDEPPVPDRGHRLSRRVRADRRDDGSRSSRSDWKLDRRALRRLSRRRDRETPNDRPVE